MALKDNFSNREKDSELLLGAKSCNLNQLKNAFQINKNINSKNSLGETPAHWLSRLNCAEGLKWAIKNGADINIKDNSGRTAHDWAKLNNSYESIQVINTTKTKSILFRIR